MAALTFYKVNKPIPPRHIIEFGQVLNEASCTCVTTTTNGDALREVMLSGLKISSDEKKSLSSSSTMLSSTHWQGRSKEFMSESQQHIQDCEENIQSLDFGLVELKNHLFQVMVPKKKKNLG